MSTLSPEENAIVRRIAERRPKPQTPAERTRAWRNAKRAAGRPESKAVDAAIVEATSFLMLILDKLPPEDLDVARVVNVEHMVRVAHIVLIGDGYDRKHALACVVERLRPRQSHEVTSKLPCLNVPTRDALVEPPRGGGRWLDRDIDLIRHLTM